jgi:hypothetical protein
MIKTRNLWFTFLISGTVLMAAVYLSGSVVSLQSLGMVKPDDEVCSSKAGVFLCVKKREHRVKLGASIAVEFLLANRSSHNFSLNKEVESNYSFIIRKQDGTIVPTREEGKLKSHVTSESEVRETLLSKWVSHRPEPQVFGINEELLEKVDLSNLYDLSAGQYSLEAARKILEFGENSVTRVRLEGIVIIVN